jgi:RNA polymerase nonessential primary-like sigma factor
VQHRDPRGILGREEERELIRRAQQSPTEAERIEARNELVLRHWVFAWASAQRFAFPDEDLDDLADVAAIAMMETVDKFDLESDVRFCSYAGWWVWHAMQDWRAESRLVAVPKWISQQARTVDDAVTQTGRASRVRTLAAVRDAQRPMAQLKPDIDGEPEADDPRPYEAIEQFDEIDRMLAVIEGLDWREREIICRRFGLGGRPRESLRAVARPFGLSHERARQIERDAIRKIRRILEPVTLSA